METCLGTRVKQISFLLVIFSSALFFLLSPNSARANQCQFHILNVGINLGWAQATLELRGDQNPQDASTISESLTRAIEHVRAAATLFRMPYRTERVRKNIDQRVIDKINRYFQLAPQLSIRQRASHVRQIWSMYRQSFQTVFTAPTPGYHYYPNCDFFILDIGYHFGRAHIAAGVINNNQVRTFQTGANGSMRSAIESGLNVAVDGYEYGTRTNTRKACCCFGVEASWRQLPIFQWNSPFRLYSDNLDLLQRIVRDAGVVPKWCSCGGKQLDPPPDPRRHCRGAIGSWNWFNGIVVNIESNNSFTSPAGNGGTWQCLPNGQIELVWTNGGWRDTLSISGDGNSLSGKNQHGVSVSATRASGGGGETRDCSQCKTYEDWLYRNGGACGYHGNRLPSICENDPECVRWNQDCNRVKQQLRECLAQCQ